MTAVVEEHRTFAIVVAAVVLTFAAAVATCPKELPKSASRDDWKKLTLVGAPVATVQHFCKVSLEFFKRAREQYLPNERLVTLGAVAAALAAAATVDGPHIAAMQTAWLYTSFAVWWFGLGVLSSIGLGTGMHTGMLFTFTRVSRRQRRRPLQPRRICERRHMWFRDPTSVFPACGGAEAAGKESLLLGYTTKSASRLHFVGSRNSRRRDSPVPD